MEKSTGEVQKITGGDEDMHSRERGRNSKGREEWMEKRARGGVRVEKSTGGEYKI